MFTIIGHSQAPSDTLAFGPYKTKALAKEALLPLAEFLCDEYNLSFDDENEPYDGASHEAITLGEEEEKRFVGGMVTLQVTELVSA